MSTSDIQHIRDSVQNAASNIVPAPHVPLGTHARFLSDAEIALFSEGRLYDAYRGMLFGEEPAEDTKQLRLDDVPLLHYCHFKLHGAEQDSFEMLEVGQSP